MFITEVMKAAGRFGKGVAGGAGEAARVGTYTVMNPVKATGHAAMWGAKQTGRAALFGTGVAAKGAYAVGGMGVRAGIKYGPGAYRKTNAFSKVAFGASVPEIAAVGGGGAVAYAALSDDPVGGVQSVGRFMGAMGDQLRMASRPTYGSTSFQQSTQGLTFGLHSRRTAY